MGNIVTSLVSGFTKVLGDLFGAPIDFLSGKSCSSKCGSTWDLLCYIENFCITNLLKLLAVSILFYIVLLFFYLLYKIGVCSCICHNTCKMLLSCLSSCFSSCEYGFMFLWFKLKNMKRIKRDHEMELEMYDSSWSDDDLEEGVSYSHAPRASKFRRTVSRHSKERRRLHIERSLRPRSHRIRVGISRSSAYLNDRGRRRHDARHVRAVHNIKVTHTSKFVQKGNRSRVYLRR
ncbi:hypothetical protein AXF42_Ash003100 [Apostasia shenzhenica]|uniref:Uncharacterized protein n=1 Tax=Apostasia shenzhenica TaxID=1088818 RepID=A0A2I0A847_9ASPA|nr:hypothetical protein AXF42_Ash003100 [Apostasia shenzhenica]